MTNDAVVTKLMPSGMAEVAVARSTACGGNCGSCEACVFQSELKAVAKNKVHAKPGDKVVIESRSKDVFSAAALVYVMPLVLFIIGYVIAHLLGASEGICALVSFIFLFIGAAILVISQKSKKKKEITFDIIEIC